MGEQYFQSGKVYTPTSASLKQASSDDYYELQKQATFFKNNNEWEVALACLYKAKFISLQNKHSPEPQYITRLAVFLQQAGMFDESVSELYDLFELSDTYTKYLIKGIRKHKKLYFAEYRANYLGHLFDKAALIHKRQKDFEKATHFKELSAKFSQESYELDRKISEIESAEYEKELEELTKPESKLTEGDWKKIRKLTQEINADKKQVSQNKVIEMIVGSLFLIAVIYGIYSYFF
ncbi:hypothetical protein ACWIUA_11125 [Ursidibacter sp. B-7004-1]